MGNQLIIPQNNLGNYIIPQDVVGGIAVDIGSNVGGFIELAANTFSKIYYYEPIIECFNICQNISSKYSHIQGYNVAVSNKIGKANIIMHENHMAGSSAIDSLAEDILELEHKDKSKINAVDTITLQEVFNNADNNIIDYMKCDCEISEYDIFMHQDMSKIKYLAIELHWQMGEERYQELVNYMLQTHELLYGNLSFPGKFNNREVLLKRKP